MNKKIFQQLKNKLEKDKEVLEKELGAFAKKDKNLEGDWDTRFPQLDGGADDSSLEKEADEVEEYGTLLPIEHSLEKKLQNVNKALEKIKKGKYGICEKCGEVITIERLKAFPVARTCTKCK